MQPPSLDNKKILEAAELYPSLWVAQHKIKNENGLPIEFKAHRFMIDLYNDMRPLQVWLKAPQVGATTAQILKSFYVAKKYNKAFIYTLPTDTDVTDMAGGKVNRIIAQNPLIQTWVREHDSVEQKSIGSAIGYYRGTWSAKKAMMVSSDLNIHDEVDASNADVITQYETRLQAKEGGWRWYFSHPSIQGYGVDIYWQQSDRKEWVIKCECGKQQILTWPESLDRERHCYQCKYCKKELSDDQRSRGEWKPTAQGIFSGYHISQMMCPWISAEAIFTAKDDPRKDEQYFWNYVLGLPYVGSENKITSEVVLKNITKEVNEQNDRIIIGVDTGLPIHYTIANKQGIFMHGALNAPSATYDPYEALEKLLLHWGEQAVIIADQGGDLIGIRKLQAKYPGRVYLVYYRKDRKTNELITWGEDDDKRGTVAVDRNRMFQLMVEQLRDVGRIRLNGTQEEWLPWAKHFDNVYRELKVVKESPGKDVSTNYGAELIWKRNGPDHYCHTLLYCLVGLDRFGSEEATFISKNNRVVFPKALDTPTLGAIQRSKLEGYVDF